ncbi:MULTISPECIES: type II toxin-antitoxin system RelE family toxin [Alkalispirochaeta]|nr:MULTISPECIES: type II toxin-antitoxin system mRNA interferase toxin, RelE/StbE family [Alkalispirochaeta]
MYKIKLTELATQMIKSVEATARTQIIRKIEQLKEEPALMGKPLLGPLKGFRTVRAAGQRYRIVYRVEDTQVVVIVVAVGIRKSGDKKDIYELMKKLVNTGIVEKDG